MRMTGDELRAYLSGETAGKKSKFHNEPTVVDGVRFDSKTEAKYGERLKLLVRAGEVLWFCRQPIFDLPGGVTYRPDFLVMMKSGDLRVVDVKGARTQGFINKKKQMAAVHGIAVEEVTG